MTGIIIKGIGGFYYVKAEDEQIYECKARGIFRKEKITPTIGDHVDIEVKNGKGSITNIYERKTLLVRPSVANIDTLVLVVAATSPEPNLPLLDKMLLNAEINHIKPVICINKIDLKTRADLEAIYRKAGYEVLSVSAEKKKDVETLRPYIKNHVTAFAGLSGVGKSSILQLITGLGLETGEVSDKIRRGKHTTRHVELIDLKEGGFVLDTPGFSSLEIDTIQASELALYFPEMEQYQNTCRFRGCSHTSEPGCTIIEKVQNGEIAKSRYESYKEFYKYLKSIKEWEK